MIRILPDEQILAIPAHNPPCVRVQVARISVFSAFGQVGVLCPESELCQIAEEARLLTSADAKSRAFLWFDLFVPNFAR